MRIAYANHSALCVAWWSSLISEVSPLGAVRMPTRGNTAERLSDQRRLPGGFGVNCFDQTKLRKQVSAFAWKTVTSVALFWPCALSLPLVGLATPLVLQLHPFTTHKTWLQFLYTCWFLTRMYSPSKQRQCLFFLGFCSS